MKKYFVIPLFCLLILIAACGETAVPEPETELNRPEGEQTIDENALNTVPTTAAEILPRATSTANPNATVKGDESYPAPIIPTAQALPEGYELATAPPAINPYPGPVIETLPQPDVTFAPLTEGVETVWVEISSGLQCDEDGASYEDIVAAMDALSAEDILVFDGATEARVVCNACGCPNSTFYRLNIDQTDLETAVSLGFAEPMP